MEGLPRINGSLLKKAINLFKNNKSCADDMVVSEMLSVLDEDVLETLADAFTKRILNIESQFVWSNVREEPKTQEKWDPELDRLDGHQKDETRRKKRKQDQPGRGEER